MQDMMVKVLPAQGTKAFQGLLVTIRQVLFISQSLTVRFHRSTGLLLCLRWAQSTLLALCPPLKFCQELKRNFLKCLEGEQYIKEGGA